MTRLKWGEAAERFFETGVDQGVLYVESDSGVAWNGLVSVSERSSGGEAKPSYLDGQKFRNLAKAEEFEATVEAFSAPKEFDICDGNVQIQNGLIATQQKRRAFSFSYRTRVGNAIDGSDHGYKIHLVYNALAAPSDSTHTTTGSDANASTRSWDITTLPPSLTGYKPTAHYIIDSRYTPRVLLSTIEDILYGSDAAQARIPLPSEIITLFQSEGPLTRTNLVGNPSFRYTSGTVEVRRNFVSNPMFQYSTVNAEMRRNRVWNAGARVNFNYWVATLQTGATPALSQVAAGGPVGVVDSFFRMTVSAATTGAIPSTGIIFGSPNADSMTAVPGQQSTLSVYTRSSVVDRSAQLVVTAHMSDGTGQEVIYTGPSTPIGSGWTRLSGTFMVPENKPRLYARIYSSAGRAWQVGDTMDATAVLNEVAEYLGPWFDGMTVFSNGLTASWAGTAHASDSIATGARPWNWTNKVGTVAWVSPDGGAWFLHPVVNDPVAITYQTSGDIPIPKGTKTAHNLSIYASPDNPGPVKLLLSALVYETVGPVTRTDGAYQTIQPGETAVFTTVSPAATTDGAITRSVVYGVADGVPAGSKYKLSRSIVESGEAIFGSYFDGSTPVDPDVGWTHAWAGTPNASQSVENAKQIVSNLTPYAPVKGGQAGTDRLRLLYKGGALWAFQPSLDIPISAGEFYAGRIELRQIGGSSPVSVSFRLGVYAPNFNGYIGMLEIITVDPNSDWVTALIPSSAEVPSGLPSPTLRLMMYQIGVTPLGTILEVRRARVDRVSAVGDTISDFFDGSTPDENANYYSWTGTPDSSTSELHTWN